MTGVLLRAGGFLLASLLAVGAYTAWAESKPRKVGLGSGLVIMLAAVVAHISGMIVGRALGVMLFEGLSGDASWIAAGRTWGVVAFALLGFWAAAILLQLSQNLARWSCGLPTKPIEWVRADKTYRRRPRRERQQG
jgi:hypothetical protein